MSVPKHARFPPPVAPALEGWAPSVVGQAELEELPRSRTGLDLARAVRARKRALFRDLTRLLALAVDYDEGVRRSHGPRVAIVAGALARALGLDEATAFYGGLIHDLGALGLAEHLVHHAARGFDDPRARQHPSRGAGLVRPLASLRALEPVLAHHHERWDGTGFPAGLHDEEIPIEAALVAFADSLDFALRDTHPEERRVRAVELAFELRGTVSPPEVAEGALRLLREDHALLEDIFRPDALAQRLARFDGEPPGLEGVTETELLAELLWMVARVVDSKCGFAPGRSARVALLAQRIALELAGAVDPWEVVWVALLHDLGSLAAPRAAVDGGFAHPTDDYEPISADHGASSRARAAETGAILASFGSLAPLARAAASVRTPWDGGGVDRGPSGEAIPLAARVVAYAERFDAMRTGVALRGGMAIDEALASLRARVGTMLDPSLEGAALGSLARGDDVGAAASDLLGFRAFFRADEAARATLASTAKVAPEEELAEAALASTVLVGRDGVIVEGAARLRELTDVDSERLLEHFAPHGRARLGEELARAGRGATLTTAHATPSGGMLELAIGLAGETVVAHVRRASRLWRSMQELALVHRNYLSSSEAVTFTDPSARIIDVNHAFTHMFGWRRDEVLGRTPKLLQSGRHPPALYRAMRESLNDPQVGAWSGELSNRTKSGSVVVVQLTVNAVRDGAGRVVGYVSNAVDVTERRRAQDALEERERDLSRKNAELERLGQFKSQMVALTSHDLRAPLSAIIGLAEGLRDAPVAVDPERLRKQLGLLADAGHRLVGLVDDLLDLDKCESGTLRLSPRRIFAHGLLRSVLGPTIDRRRAVVREPTRDHAFVGDPERLEQALANLLSNALKFSPDDAPVELGFDVVDGLDVPAEEARLRFWVADRGPGIPAYALESVFDRYVQVDRRSQPPGVPARRGAGIGLGLAIVGHLAELHGGRAFAENRASGGCRFVLELPVAGVAAAPPPSAVIVGPRSDDSARVARGLVSAGWRVLMADRESEGLRRLALERAGLALLDERWLDASMRRAIEGARDRGALTAIVRADDDAAPDGAFDWELVSPVMDLEIASMARAAVARCPWLGQDAGLANGATRSGLRASVRVARLETEVAREEDR